MNKQTGFEDMLHREREHECNRKPDSQETWYVPVCPGCFEDMPLGAVHVRTVETCLSEETMNFDAAQEWAKKQGGRCLTKEEIHLLLAAKIIKEGDTSFWSSSVVSSDRYDAWIFSGDGGYISSDDRYNAGYGSARCVVVKE